MAFYESVFIARQDISATQADALADKYGEIIQTGGGTVAKRENWGLRTLAYRIRKNRKGHYILMNIDAPAEAVLEMERNMRIDEDVIRYLTIRVDELDEGPSPVMRNRGGRDRDDRGPRGRDSRDSRDSRDDSDRQKNRASDTADGGDTKSEGAKE
ncbi:MAG: 30S ribosomal protein S6 [Alphaproteobacteria bacterium]|nr:30S ribosomal protein S6 [Alphaproteobacteria bacterium]